MKSIRPAVYLLCLLLFASAAGFAQTAGGSLARVVAKQISTGRTFETVTTGEGLYSYANLTEIGVSFSPKHFVDAPIFAGGIRTPEAFIGFQPGVVNGAGAEGGISGGQRRWQAT
ncbi:MAG: hypothetical protein SF339_06410 [Blastocatellia bacterium]|nr:hypothetical protein [Blastocatellia bacterium]